MISPPSSRKRGCRITPSACPRHLHHAPELGLHVPMVLRPSPQQDGPRFTMVRDLSAIIRPGDTPRERVRKIFNHVTRRIRYVGFELGIGGIRPRSAGETYESGMGDCKDITLVLVALLRAAGIDARIALVRTADRGRPDMNVPWVGAFNHAICYVNIDGGFFLDGTTNYRATRKCQISAETYQALVMDKQGYRIIGGQKDAFYSILRLRLRERERERDYLLVRLILLVAYGRN